MRNWTLTVALLLAGCGSASDPAAPSPPGSPAPVTSPAPTPASPYAGTWSYRTTLLAIDRNCGHTAEDIGQAEGPFPVTIASNGTFDLPGGSRGAIDAAGNVTVTLAAASGDCRGGSGAGGCRDHDHCDGTSEQAGDVKKWTLFRD